MKTEISIRHSTYMMTIKEVIEAIESASNVRVVKITVNDDVLTFHVEELYTLEDETEIDDGDPANSEFWDEYAQEKEDEGFE